jgi:hypothetical protein
MAAHDAINQIDICRLRGFDNGDDVRILQSRQNVAPLIEGTTKKDGDRDFVGAELPLLAVPLGTIIVVLQRELGLFGAISIVIACT